ncbi:MAG: sulfite exporter TauE/SafE family protein [Planctomycetes bacterium]|nr:sulfite exporter TauE/SafE family protein [Planctomycetota bacterium]
MNPLGYPELALLAGLGLVAGILNTLAGGGSMLLVPTMIFFGIPATAANASLRPAILMQGLFGLVGFRRAGILDRSFLRSVLPLALPVLPGALLGAYLVARRIDDRVYELILALVLGVLALLSLRARRGTGPARTRPGPVQALILFGVGLYGGFIQIGVGFVLASALIIGRWSRMAEVHAAKVAIVFCYTIAVLPIFLDAGLVVWPAAAALILGQSGGGFLGAQLAGRLPDRLLRLVYVGAMLAFALALAIRALW